jgi:UDP-N-acetylglucosamine:LPS N-acetylglucosamine transferase
MSRNPDLRVPRLLAVASGGGHWVQMRRLQPAWQGCEVSYVTTDAGYRAQLDEEARVSGRPGPGFHTVIDANRWQKLRLVWQIAQIAWIVLRVRPDVVISTGAAPGFFALLFGRIVGARTIWIDSIANAQELSMAGRKAKGVAHLFLTQWAHLSENEGPKFRGKVI